MRRNRQRFPPDFMFQLTRREVGDLRFQNDTSSLSSQFGTSRWGGRRYLPYVFTEQGVTMLSEEKMKRLTSTLHQQTAKAARLDAAIAANLKELGCGS